ncbi:MAG TPA: hypothetical protein VIL34_01850 [Actinopolymorphaceae bacterium]
MARVAGHAMRRLAVQTHFVTPGESYMDLLTRYVSPLYRPGDIVASGEKVLAMCQNRVISRNDVTVGFLARHLSKFATSNDHGIGMDEPAKLQLAIDLVGRPRILFAAFLSAVTKLVGVRGVFYRVAGAGIAGIDGFYERSAFDFYKRHAILNPRDPVKVCNDVHAKLGILLAVFDANDLGIELFGKPDALARVPDEFLKAVMRDNPAGQSDEMTPFIILRPEPAVPAQREPSHDDLRAAVTDPSDAPAGSRRPQNPSPR